MVYDSAKVNQLRNFALSDAIQILVINIDAFAKDSSEAQSATGKPKKAKGNVINQVRETGAVSYTHLDVYKRQGKGYGRLLLGHAMNCSVALRKQLGVRVLLVDAMDEHAAAFYKLHGFNETAEQALTLYLSLIHI